MVDTSGFAKLVPGFDFLEGLVKNAGSAMPGIGQWVAPTLNPEELEQAHRGIAHRAVLAGAERAHARRDDPGARGAAHDAVDAEDDERADGRPAGLADDSGAAAGGRDASGDSPHAPQNRSRACALPAPASAPAVDPMQWWGALTKQFTELATSALKRRRRRRGARGLAAKPAPAKARAPRKPAARPAAKAAPRKRG